ncbi:hypothetical protein Tco_1260216 [Tanacetum coccineum]
MKGLPSLFILEINLGGQGDLEAKLGHMYQLEGDVGRLHDDLSWLETSLRVVVCSCGAAGRKRDKESTFLTKGMRSIISMVSISLEGFLVSILLLMVIIVAVVIVTVIRVVVVVAIVGVVIVVAIIGITSIYSQTIKFIFHFLDLSSRTILVCQESLQFSPGDPIGLFYSDGLSVCIPPRQGIIGQGIYLGLVFLLGLSAFAMAAACASRVAAIPSIISCWMASSVIVGVADVDVLLGGIYMQDSTE